MMSVAALQNGKPGQVTPADLAELLSTFNGVTSRLQETHETLHREVVRLKAELRDANEQLQRSRRLAALGEMAAGIAHEVRNPLGSIGLYARMLEQDLLDRPPQRDIAAKIAVAVSGLNGVVGDVLNFARDLRTSPEAVNADQLFQRAIDACVSGDEPRVIRRGKAKDGAGLEVWCDPILMNQALVNILRNAIEAMEEAAPPRDGHALILEAMETRGADRRPAATLIISDTGPGVTREVVDRMFNPFFTTRKTGTGLGLSIVHRIVDAHGGRIVVRNNAERAPGAPGATFEVHMPMRGGASRASETEGSLTHMEARQRPQESSR